MNRDDIIKMLALTIGFPTLETRNMDSLDFREVAVWEIKKVLELAYQAGKESN